MATEKSIDEVRDLTDEELDIAVSGPAIFSNRFYVIAGPNGVRISFADQSGPKKKTYFRTAVTLSFTDAMILTNVLEKMIRQSINKIEKSNSKTTSEPSEAEPPLESSATPSKND